MPYENTELFSNLAHAGDFFFRLGPVRMLTSNLLAPIFPQDLQRVLAGGDVKRTHLKKRGTLRADARVRAS